MIGPAEEPQRQLSGTAAAAACVAAWVIVLAAALLVLGRWSGWPGSRPGLIIVSATALAVIICIVAVSRRRGGGQRMGPTTWTMPTRLTVTRRQERRRRLEQAIRDGRVADDDRAAAAALARERLADAGAGMLQAAMPAVVGTINLANRSAWGGGTAGAVLSGTLVAVGAAMMLFQTRAVLRWRQLAAHVPDQPSPRRDVSRR